MSYMLVHLFVFVFLFVCYSFTLGSGFDYPVMFYALAQCLLCFVLWSGGGGGGGEEQFH